MEVAEHEPPAVATGTPRHRRRIVVIGAGPGGLCAAIRLRAAGHDDVTIVEQAPGVGGTWYHNRYPGAECDVQSHLYSFSFAPKTDWSRPYARQPEILPYFEGLVDEYGLEPHLRLGVGVRAARWDDATATWTVELASGEELQADVIVSTLGMFTDLRWPDVPGLESFAGTLFHSARWAPDASLAGRTVAVIGTAASAVQLIPEVAAEAGRLLVFQRTPNWVLPKADDPFTPEQLEAFRTDPESARVLRREIWERVEAAITFSNPEALRLAEDVARRHLDVLVDPDVRARMTPTVPWGCQRPLSSNTFYPTFNEPHVRLVTEPVERVTPAGIVTADGVEHAVDVIVAATGFAATRYLSAIDVTGRDGRHLAEEWAEGAQAYLGITTSGFPNLFMLYGPNTNNGSILYMLECQADHVVRLLRHMDDHDLAWIDVRPEVMAAYNEALQRDLDRVEVWQAGCSGYYRAPSGRIVTQWPHTMTEYRARTATVDADAYEGAPISP